MNKKTNKYEYLHILQGNYGYGDGWEDLTASTQRLDVKRDLHDYTYNEGANYRIIQRRVLKDPIPQSLTA